MSAEVAAGVPARLSWRRLARPWIAWSITIATLALFVTFGSLLFSAATPPAVFKSWGVITAFWVFPFASFAAVGGILGARRPTNPIGWLFLLGSGATIVGALATLVGELLAVRHIPTAQWVMCLAVLWSAPVIAGDVVFLILLLLLPDGLLLADRWRWLAYLASADGVFAAVLFFVNSAHIATGIRSLSFVSPVAVPGSAPLVSKLTTACQAGALACLVGGFICLCLRFRGADAQRRHQLRWILCGMVVALVVSGVLNTLPATSGSDPGPILTPIVGVMLIVGIAAIPSSIGVAVMRYRLYDIDLVISRALVYGSLAVSITAVYVGIAVGLGYLVGSAGRPNLGLSILATAVVAVGFQPVRERLQRVANRLVYGPRATPYEVLSRFSSRVAEAYAGDEVLVRMARVLREGTGADATTVWLRSGNVLRPAANSEAGSPPRSSTSNGWGPPVDWLPLPLVDADLPKISGVTRAVAVRHRDELLGALTVVKRRGEVLTPIEERLILDLAHQAGLVLKNVGLTADLQARLEELRQSRQRLVAAQDAARRRLERDLHDGAQQHLVALKLKLGVVEMLLPRDAGKARATLAQLGTDADEALETLRELARGIYPPLLADQGLRAALESQARKAAVPVELEAEGLGRYPQDLEASVYFCCLEAMQNVQKYAQAARVVVRLREDDGALCFHVEDDGRGLDPATVRHGSGLTNMRDRLNSLGGSLEIASRPGGGTIVRGRVPLTETGLSSSAREPATGLGVGA